LQIFLRIGSMGDSAVVSTNLPESDLVTSFISSADFCGKPVS
jgi:hypothetical protein